MISFGVLNEIGGRRGPVVGRFHLSPHRERRLKMARFFNLGAQGAPNNHRSATVNTLQHIQHKQQLFAFSEGEWGARRKPAPKLRQTAYCILDEPSGKQAPQHAPKRRKAHRYCTDCSCTEGAYAVLVADRPDGTLAAETAHMIKITISLDETELSETHPMIRVLTDMLEISKVDERIDADYETEAWLRAFKLEPESEMTRTEVREALVAYCRKHNIPAPTFRRVYATFRNMGCREKKIMGVRYICGIATVGPLDPEFF